MGFSYNKRLFNQFKIPRRSFAIQLRGQGQWPALDLPDVAGPHTLGRKALGSAVLTVLVPSERYYQERGRPHKKVTD